MAGFNSVVLLGNITRDLSIRYTPGGTAVCDIGLAVNRKFKAGDGQMQEEVLFVDCTVWGALAENCANYLSKGRPVLVAGYLKSESWEDKDSGKTRSKIKVVATNVQFLGGGQEGGGQQGGGEQRQANPPQERPEAGRTTRGGEGKPDDAFNNADIPF